MQKTIDIKVYIKRKTKTSTKLLKFTHCCKQSQTKWNMVFFYVTLKYALIHLEDQKLTLKIIFSFKKAKTTNPNKSIQN